MKKFMYVLLQSTWGIIQTFLVFILFLCSIKSEHCWYHGARSVVTKDIPDNVVAVGNPCHILREIGERDDIYFYKQEKIDWENF